MSGFSSTATRPETRCCASSACPMSLSIARRRNGGLPVAASLAANGSITSNTALTSRSSRASATVLASASAITRKRGGDRFLIWIGPLDDFCSSPSGAISSTAVSSSPSALNPLTRDRSFASKSSSSSGLKPTMTATPKRNNAGMPRSPTRKASGSEEIMSGRSSPAVSMRSPTIRARAVRRGRAVIGGTAGRCPIALFPDRLAGSLRHTNALGEVAMDNRSDARWRLDGVRVVRSNELDINTAQTPGMNRAAAITHARAGAEKLWAGTVVIHPKAKTGAHHHGPVESVIYVVSGRARMRWGDRLEFIAEAGPGDFIYVPPFVPHQEINASDEAPLSCVLVRSGQEPVVVNLDLPNVESNPETVEWVDELHPPHKH